MESAVGFLCIGFLVALAVLGPFFGADSRDGRDWRPTGRRAAARTGRVRALAKRQVVLWDAYLTADQPWRERGPLRWRRAGGAWVLDGDTPPAAPADRDGDPEGLRIGPPRDGS
ncbi:hypothetical protein [Yinghuangia soli]|uniref:Uncharacterized protein n=1 Tax=Yinghuangia soli TaxID=2908204 RepID=A0AA41PYA5_9ACTN|nr:hypothetical protein [Yinghuangia soli]MCF2527615.1 hypothetical protein [Yinghuangia soli]